MTRRNPTQLTTLSSGDAEVAPPSRSLGWASDLDRFAQLALWPIVVIVAVGLCIAGVHARRLEMLTPCSAQCLTGQYPLEDHRMLERIGFSPEAYFWVLEGVSLLTVAIGLVAGALIFVRQRQNRAAVLASLFLVLVPVGASFNVPALERAYPHLWPVTRWFAVATSVVVPALFYVFPSGRFTPPWIRWVLLAWGLAQVAHVFVPTTPLIDTPFPLVQLALIVGGIASQLHRFRAVSTPVERQQTKWVVAAIGYSVFTYVIGLPYALAAPHDLVPMVWGQFVLYLVYCSSLVLIPAAFVFSILKHRLWDIDLLIHRSLVYGSLTVLLAVAFVLGAWGIGSSLQALVPRGAVPLSLATTLVLVGMLFTPARRALERVVDRRVFGIDVDYRPAARPAPRVRVTSARTLGSALRGETAADTTVQAGDKHPWDDAAEEAILVREQVLGELRRLGYEDLSLVGAGGMAEVYRAREASSGQLVAIKVLAPGRHKDRADVVRRFELEAKILAHLVHPNIIRLERFGATSTGARFLVMEYVAGGDLAAMVVRRGALPLGQALPVLADIALALDYAHEHGVVHRDIKPSNVLLRAADAARAAATPDGVLTDFGIAKARVTAQLDTSRLLGTLCYMAPEQIRDASLVDARADVYSFAVLAFEVLAGSLPFEAEPTVKLLIDHLRRPPPDVRRLAPELPEAVADALREGLEKDPALRPARASDIVRKMRRGLAAPAPIIESAAVTVNMEGMT